MNRYWRNSFLALVMAGVPAAGWEPREAQEIVRKSLEKDRFNSDRARDYTYVQRVEERELDANGRVNRTKASTFDVLRLGGRPYRRLIAKDDRPLTGEEARKVGEKFEREVEKRRREGEGERRARLEEEEKSRREERSILNEIPEAFTFRLEREEKVDGLPVWVIEAQPKAGYRGKAKRWELLTKFRGRLWIAQGDYQWVKVEAETIAPVSFGWVLARLQPGARLTFEQQRVNAEVWLPSRATTKVDARVALFKKYRAEVDVRWKEYRKFQAESRVVGAEEVPVGKPER